MSRLNDLTGRKFGRLTVLERAPDQISPSGRHRVRWHCKCECGKESFVNPDALLSGRVISCGCWSREKARLNHLTHGESGTRLHNIWLAMKRRCDTENIQAYRDYGGRGITVCQEWYQHYEAFRDWAMANGYTDDLSIDRIDNNGDYTPQNCRWVDSVAQANNRRSNHLLTYQGETHTLTEWAHKIGLNYQTLYSRIYAGWDTEKALTT